MRKDVICYEPHNLSLRLFKILFSKASLTFTAAKLFPQVILERIKPNASTALHT